MKPGSIIHARSIYGPRMADRQPVCTILAHVAHGFCRCMLALQNCYLRLALVLWLAQALGHTWTVESPAKLHEHPRWKVFAVPTKMFRVRFWVASWGGVSPKKLRILSNSRAIVAFDPALQARLAKMHTKNRIAACKRGKEHTGSHGRNMV